MLLIVDEAQNLSLKVLEEVRMLSGVETTKEKVLRIILAGQPELNEKLDAPELVQLAQRVRLRFHLGTLSATEMHAYIHHRLEVAGAGDREIFAEDIYPVIYRYTGGVPRLVNTLCDTAMLAAFGQDRDHVAARGRERLDRGTAAGRNRRPSPASRPRRAGMTARTGQSRAPRIASRSDGHRRMLWSTPRARVTRRPVGRVDRWPPRAAPPSELRLKVGRIIIGRTSDNDLQVDSRFVSRHHCQIITGAEGSVIEDLNSTNGIFVQGKRVRRHNLNDGDVVVIGKHEIMYVDERLAHGARCDIQRKGAGVPTLDKPVDDRAHVATVVDPDRDADEPAAGRAADSASSARRLDATASRREVAGWGNPVASSRASGRVVLGAQPSVATPPQQHHDAGDEPPAARAGPAPDSGRGGLEIADAERRQPARADTPRAGLRRPDVTTGGGQGSWHKLNRLEVTRASALDRGTRTSLRPATVSSLRPGNRRGWPACGAALRRAGPWEGQFGFVAGLGGHDFTSFELVESPYGNPPGQSVRHITLC